MEELIRTRFGKAVSHYDDHAHIQKEIVRILFGLIRQYGAAPDYRGKNILEMGCGTGNLSRLLHTLHPRTLVLNDLCPEYENILREKLCTSNPEDSLDTGRSGIQYGTGSLPAKQKQENFSNAASYFLCGDMRQIAAELNRRGKRFHLIASSSALQWIDDPGTFLGECKNLLLPGGLLAISTFAPGNLIQTACLTGRSLSYISRKELEAILENRFRILYLREEERELRFPDPLSVLRHLKATGVNGLETSCWTRGKLEKFIRDYRRLFSDAKGTCPLTYRPLYFLCRAE